MVDTATKLRRAFIATPKIFYAVLLVVLCILFADLKGRPRTFNSPETRILERIFRNVHQNPITDITAITTGTCPTGFSIITLGSWPGTVLGCRCGDTITPGSCTTSGCTTIQAVPAQHITRYKGNQFCVQRNTDVGYPDASGACTGTTTFSCPGSKVCIPSGEPCPINSLQISIDATTNAATITKSSTGIGEPVTDLQVSLFDLPCMDPNAMPYNRDKVPYPLSAIPENGCGGTGRIEHLMNLDNLEMIDLFNENSLTSALSLPKYQEYVTGENAYMVSLLKYQLAESEAKCGVVDPVRFTEVQKDENFYVSRVYPLIIASIVVMSIKFATIIIELIIRIRKNEEEDHWLNLFAGVNLLLLLGACVLFIIIGGYGAHAVVKLTPNTNYFKLLSNNQCFQQTVVNRIFQVFRGNISNFWAIVWLSITLLIVACSCIIVTIILAVINHCYGNQRDFSSYYKSVGKRLGKSKTKNNKNTKTPVNNSTNIEMLLAR